MSHKRKTLVILTPGFAKDESDTTCLPMQQSFIRALNEKYPDLNIIILAFQYPYETKTYQWHGNTVISFNGRNRGGLTKLFLFQKWNVALKKIHKEYNIVGLLSFWYRECALIGKRFGDRYGIKHFCWMWGQDARKGNKYALLVKLKPNELIAFSDFLQDEFERNYKIRPLYVITPGIDVPEISSNSYQKDIDILGVGSLITLKQYDAFIRVIAEIKKQFPFIKASIIGEGHQRQKLQELIDVLGLKSNITLAGELQHPEVLRSMQKAKLFIHPSSYEGFGIVCIEALASGAEVISFVRPMHAEIEKWHIAATKEEMVNIAMKILAKPAPDNKSVVPYPMERTVQQMAELFSF